MDNYLILTDDIVKKLLPKAAIFKEYCHVFIPVGIRYLKFIKIDNGRKDIEYYADGLYIVTGKKKDTDYGTLVNPNAIKEDVTFAVDIDSYEYTRMTRVKDAIIISERVYNVGTHMGNNVYINVYKILSGENKNTYFPYVYIRDQYKQFFTSRYPNNIIQSDKDLTYLTTLL